MTRRALHALMAAAGIVWWVVLAILGLGLAGFAALGHLVWPRADWGNCWTFALAMWVMHGGRLEISIRRVGWLRIPHAAWIRPDGVIEETEPVQRRRDARAAWGGLATLYFRFTIKRRA